MVVNLTMIQGHSTPPTTMTTALCPELREEFDIMPSNIFRSRALDRRTWQNKYCMMLAFGTVLCQVSPDIITFHPYHSRNPHRIKIKREKGKTKTGLKIRGKEQTKTWVREKDYPRVDPSRSPLSAFGIEWTHFQYIMSPTREPT